MSKDFIGLGIKGEKMSKREFLTVLQTGHYIPINVAAENIQPVYRLIQFTKPNPDIQLQVAMLGKTELKLYDMEGKELPDFNFTDLNGTRYNKENTKGKVILLKCWFIRCQMCVEEFPKLNELADRFKERSDVGFISLAWDSKKDLNAFLAKKPLNFPTVPDLEQYLDRTLALDAYPTHILINRDGKILKVTNSIETMIPHFEKAVEHL